MHDNTYYRPAQLLALTKKGSAPRGLLSARGEEWKTARHTLSPSFSAAKMKAVSLPILYSA